MMPTTRNLADRRLLLPILALLALLLATGPAPALAAEREEKGPSKQAVVPFELLATNHMLVTAKINGKGPFRLIFDLGAPITLLSNKASEASGVVKPNAPRAFLFSLRGEGEIETLVVGDLTAKDLPVIILDHPILKAMGNFLGKPLDGIMGFTFFARYRTTIDYQTRRMTFEPVAYEVRNLMKDLPERLAGPKVAERRVVAPGGFWGLTVGDPVGGVESEGVPIVAVWPDSPAARAGLKTGDTLSSLDGRWTTSIADTYTAASGVAPGQAVAVVVRRDGEERTFQVTPAQGL